ncbi:hypothetical protein H5410_060044 [Solanum commersonii]|uniref:Uncharacterized protein n=1 Tax=Solanum commersonii TaxID=4109 RepID=A0A9J5W5C3_SOLCO|nr:hypothetical protein H5410_060044 [Solanum commersonii]
MTVMKYCCRSHLIRKDRIVIAVFLSIVESIEEAKLLVLNSYSLFVFQTRIKALIKFRSCPAGPLWR